MALHIVKESEPIKVERISLCIYGGLGRARPAPKTHGPAVGSLRGTTLPARRKRTNRMWAGWVTLDIAQGRASGLDSHQGTTRPNHPA